MADPAVSPGEARRVAYTLDVVSSRADLNGLRVLDLACCHGAFAAAFAAAGADVLGIDGRQDNLDHVPPGPARYELCDVRDLSRERHGTFDVTLCLGILYHLEAADALRLLAAMRDVTARFAVIDTHIGAEQGTVAVDGRTYRGRRYREARGQRRSSIGNADSWWFTEQSLTDALRAAGWAGITRLAGRPYPGEPADRRWLVVS